MIGSFRTASPRTIKFGILQLLLILTTAFAFCSCESEDSIPPYYDTTKASASGERLETLIANSDWDLLAAVQSEAGKDVSVDLAMDGDWVRFAGDTVSFYSENIIYDADTGETTLRSDIIRKYNYYFINNCLVIGGKSFSLFSANDGTLVMECDEGWSLVLAPRNDSHSLTRGKNYELRIKN